METTCSRCGRRLPEGLSFCPQCGNRLGAARCYRCGNELPNGSGFCAFCGAIQPGAETTPAAPPQGQASAAGTFSPPPPKKKRSVGVIIGAVAGTVALIAVLIGGYFAFPKLFAREPVGPEVSSVRDAEDPAQDIRGDPSAAGQPTPQPTLQPTPQAALQPELLQLPCVYDACGLLTEQQAASLNALAEDYTGQFHCALAVAAVPDTGGRSVEQYAEELYTSLGLGYGGEKSGVLLLLSMEGRDYDFLAHNDGGLFGGNMKDSIMSGVLPLLGQDKWYEAFSEFLEACGGVLAMSQSEEFRNDLDGWEDYLGDWETGGSAMTMHIERVAGMHGIETDGYYSIEIRANAARGFTKWTYFGNYASMMGGIACYSGSCYAVPAAGSPTTNYEETGTCEITMSADGTLAWWHPADSYFQYAQTGSPINFYRSGGKSGQGVSAGGGAAESWTSLSTPFLVQTGDLPIYTGPGVNYDRKPATTGVGIYTIVEVSPGSGSLRGWGRLKSGAGWINLDDCSLYR